MTPLRILHVVPYYEQAWAYGGIPRLATTMTQALARRGHRVTVCTTDACDATSRARAAAPSASGLDVQIFPNLSNHLAYHWQMFAPMGLGAYLRSALAGGAAFHVAHLHACHNLLSSIAARVLAGSGVPYLVSPNGTAKPIERRILAKRVFAATVGRHVLAGAARVVSVSDAERAQLVALGVPPEAIVTVPNPIDPAEFSPPPDPDRFRNLHDLGRLPVVLFLGKLTPRKGVDVLVRAWTAGVRTDAALVIAGNDMGSGPAIDALVRTLAGSRRVVRTGLLRGRDRLDALAAADVVVYPSRDEIFGLVPLEAMLCGTPVVVCDDSGCREVVQRTGGGLAVPFGDAPALTQAIEQILSAPASWRERARSAGERASALYGVDVVCDRLEQVYADVVGSRAHRERTMA